MFCYRLHLDPLPARDSAQYLYFAEKIGTSSWRQVLQTSDDVTLSKPPLLLALLSAAVRCGIDVRTAGNALMLLSHLLLCTALALIAEELWHDWRLSASTLLLAAALPLMVRYSVHILRDPLYWCLAAWTIFWALRGVNGKNPYLGWLGSAVCCALAILSRREGVELVAIIGLYLAFGNWRKAEWPRLLLKKLLTGVAFFAVVTLLVWPVEHKMAQWGSHWNSGQFSAVSYYWSRLWQVR